MAGSARDHARSFAQHGEPMPKGKSVFLDQFIISSWQKFLKQMCSLKHCLVVFFKQYGNKITNLLLVPESPQHVLSMLPRLALICPTLPDVILSLSLTVHHAFLSICCRLSGFNLARHLKGELSGNCGTATFDVDSESRREHPDESCILSDGPAAVGDLLVDRQGRDPNQSQIVAENQSSSVGGEDARADHERLSPHVEHAAADLKGDGKELEADVVEGSQEIPLSLEGHLVEGKEEAQTLERNDPGFDDVSERPGSAGTPSEPADTANDESSIQAGAGGPDDPLARADETGEEVEEEGEEEVAERTELGDDEVAVEDDNAEMSCSAEPELDSDFTAGKQPQSLESRKRDRRAQEQDHRSRRSLRLLKVLDGSAVIAWR